MKGVCIQMVYFYNDESADMDLLDKYGTNEMSPALKYASVTVMEDILNDIARGVIPSGTGEVFSVIWKNDAELSLEEGQRANKPNFVGSNTNFINPIPDLVTI